MRKGHLFNFSIICPGQKSALSKYVWQIYTFNVLSWISIIKKPNIYLLKNFHTLFNILTVSSWKQKLQLEAVLGIGLV